LDSKGQPGDWRSLLASIDHSLISAPPPAATATGGIQSVGLRVIASVSLLRFRQLILSSCSPAELQAAVSREFEFYQATGKDGKEILFTAYYDRFIQPVACPRQSISPIGCHLILPGGLSRIRLASSWKARMVWGQSRLRGLEMVWLRDRLEAFLVQIKALPVYS